MKFAAKFLIAMVLLSPTAARSQTDADWDWVNKHFPQVYDHFFPIEPSILGFRRHRDLFTDELEYAIAFVEDPHSKKVVLRVRTAASMSIYDQLMALHLARPSAPVGEFLPKLKVNETVHSLETCSTLGDLYDKYDGLFLPMLTPLQRRNLELAKHGAEQVVLHPAYYDFAVPVPGGRSHFTLTDDEHPFVEWALSVHAAAERCSKSKGRHTP